MEGEMANQLTLHDLYTACEKMQSYPPFPEVYTCILKEDARRFLEEHYGHDWRERAEIELSYYTPTLGSVIIIDDAEISE